MKSWYSGLCLAAGLLSLACSEAGAGVARQMERLDRGLVAVSQGGGKVFLSWRMWGTDPSNVAFNVYRDGKLVNSAPITGATNLVDADGSTSAKYTVRAIVNGKEESADPP